MKAECVSVLSGCAGFRLGGRKTIEQASGREEPCLNTRDLDNAIEGTLDIVMQGLQTLRVEFPHPAQVAPEVSLGHEVREDRGEVSDRICGKRLKPLLPVLVAALERHGHLQLDQIVRTELLAISDLRTRRDPFEDVWPDVVLWLEREPDRTAKELFGRLQDEHPGVFRDGQLRTLQRRVKDWRRAAARRLVLQWSPLRPPGRRVTSVRFLLRKRGMNRK